MVAKSSSDTLKLAKDLGEGINKHYKYVNQLWLAVVVAAGATVFPKATGDDVIAPFGLGVVESARYFPVMFFLLFGLTIAYCQGHAKAYEASEIAYATMRRERTKRSYEKLRDVFDFFRVDSIARTWPLVSLLLIQMRSPIWLAVVFYLVLKVAMQLVLLGLPLVAMWFAFQKIPEISVWLDGLAAIAAFILLLAVLELLVAEFKFSRQVVARIRKHKHV